MPISVNARTSAVLRATVLRATVLLLLTISAQANQASLPPCPSSPNCVSSLATDKAHFIEPLSGARSAEQARLALTETLKALDRVEWNAASDRHIQATFTSLIFRFVDDVDFVILDSGDINVRSASRVGHSDLGANRRRIEDLRKRFSDVLAVPSSATP